MYTIENRDQCCPPFASTPLDVVRLVPSMAQPLENYLQPLFMNESLLTVRAGRRRLPEIS